MTLWQHRALTVFDLHGQHWCAPKKRGCAAVFFCPTLFISVLPAQYYSHRLTWTKGSQKGRNILYLKGEQRVITRSNGLSNPEAQNAVWIVQMWLELQRKQSATILIISWSLTSFFMQRWQKLLILTPQIWRFSAISNIEKDVVIDGLC